MIDLTAPFLTPAEQAEELYDLERTWPLAKIIKSHIAHPAHAIDLSVVVGSYKGKVMQWLLNGSTGIEVIGFEPQKWANVVARERLASYKGRWVLKEYGLYISDLELPMYNFGTDACSMVPPALDAQVEAVGEFKDIAQALALPIDLMVVNIEGAEFAIVEALLAAHPKHLAIQFHTDFASAADYHYMLYRLDGYYGYYTYHYHHALSSWGYWWS